MSRATSHHELFHQVFDHAFDAILMLDPRTDRILDANQQAQQMLGYSRRGLQSLPLSRICLDPDRAELSNGKTERGWVGPMTFRARDGVPVCAETSLARVATADGDCVIAAARPAPDSVPPAPSSASPAPTGARGTAELATVSELAAALADEINQPLAAIVLNARFAERMAADAAVAPELRETLKDIARDGRRAGDVVWKLRRMLEGEQLERRHLDVSRTIQDIASTIHDQVLNDRVTLVLQLTAGLPSVLGDRERLQQVVLSVVKSAVEDMRQIGLTKRVLAIETAATSGSVQILIRDGSLAHDHRNPPTRTNPSGQLGLALALSRAIVEAHGGGLTVERAATGSTVRIVLPADARVAAR